MRRNLFVGKMQSGGFGLSLFTEDELEQIHFATLEVLKKTGLYVEDKEALRILGDSGAIVDVKNRIVKFPAYLVEDSLGSAPPIVFLAGREDKHDIVLESSRVGFTAFGEGIILVDPHTGERRKPTKADSAISAILLDYLSEIDVNKKVIGAHDVPQQLAHLHIAETLLQNTTKHCFMGPGNGMLLNKIVEMGVAISGSRSQLKDRPLISFATCPVSPLKLIKETCEIIMESAKSGMMVNVLSMAMAGGSSPISLAGTLVIHNAEVLGGLVLSQCTRKGAPFMYGSSTTAMDMRLAAATVGSPECGMINAAVARLANYYGLPSWVAGGQSDSKLCDNQTGHEKTLTGLLPALAGANLIYGLGMIECGITFDLAQLVIDNEYAKMIKHAVGGIPVNDESLAVDVIHEIGIGKDFLSHESTYNQMKSISHSRLIDRSMREDWELNGSKDIYERAREKVISILDTHKPKPLQETVIKTLREIVEETESELGLTKK